MYSCTDQNKVVHKHTEDLIKKHVLVYHILQVPHYNRVKKGVHFYQNATNLYSITDSYDRQNSCTPTNYHSQPNQQLSPRLRD